MEIVDEAVGCLRREGIAVDGVHHLANCFTIADRIAEAAQDWGADVIVFGSKRRRWLRRFSGAGLRERVTGITGLPVLVAPAPLKLAWHNPGRETEHLLAVPVGDEPLRPLSRCRRVLPHHPDRRCPRPRPNRPGGPDSREGKATGKPSWRQVMGKNDSSMVSSPNRL